MKSKLAFTAVLAVGWLFLAAVAVAAAEDVGANPRLSAGDRQELLDLLQRSQAELRGLVADVDGAHWAHKPGPDRWSVGEVVEHLILAEDTLYGRVLNMVKGEPDADWQQVDALPLAQLVAAATDRSRRFEAPDAIRPSGKLSRKQALERYRVARERTLELVRNTELPLKQFTGPSPLSGTVSAKHWLAFVAAHNFRHNQQIAEVIREMAE